MRGVGGIRLAGDDCSTGVPGLYAAGDAASRERLTGAISGGGGPNSSWAIASGNWAGRAAAAYTARRVDAISERQATRARPRRAAAGAATCTTMLDAADIVQVVREEMLPLDRNFFRDGATLERSLDRLDASLERTAAALAGRRRRRRSRRAKPRR